MLALYLLKFSSGKAYVGQTVRAMNIRLQQHRTAAKRGSELPVHCAWRKYGEPEVMVLGEYETQDALHRAEIEAIARLGTISPGGYNVSVGGDTAPSKNPEVAKKIASRAKGRKYADTSPWVESTSLMWQDPEYREKVLSGVAASFTEERRAKIGARMRELWAKRKAEGWTMPDATKEKIRKKVVSEESRAKMSESAKRRGIPPEQRAKIAASRRGKKQKPASEARRKSLSDGVKAAWADPIKRERLMAARKAAGETRRKEKAMGAIP